MAEAIAETTAKATVIKPKDIRRLCDGGVIAGPVQKVITDIMTDSKVRPACIDSTVDGLLRQKQGTVALMREGKQLLSFKVGPDAVTAALYPQNCNGSEDRYEGVAARYGLSIIRY